MIVGQYYSCSIKIDDVSFTPKDPTALVSVKIVEAVKDGVPFLELVLKNSLLQTDDIPPIHDGTLISVAVRHVEESGGDIWMPFRAFSIVTSPGVAGFQLISVSAYFDVPDLFLSAKFKDYKGTSASVAKTLGQESDLIIEDTDIDQTADAMTWIRAGVTGLQFLQDITRAAYKNDESVYASCITKTGVLKFQNLSARKASKVKWTFQEAGPNTTETKPEELVFSEYKHKRVSGLLNRAFGYGMFGAEFSIVNGEVNEPFIETVSKEEDSLEVRADLAEPTKMLSRGIDCGNTHKHFLQATMQNKKGLALFSTSLDVLTTAFKSDIELLDLVDVRLASETEDGASVPIDGKYFVSRMALLVTPSMLLTKYELIREGFTAKKRSRGTTK